MSGNFILEFPSIKSSPILALTHACISTVVICSLIRSHGLYINTQDAYGLYDRLITAMRAVEIHDAKMCKQNQATNVLFLEF